MGSGATSPASRKLCALRLAVVCNRGLEAMAVRYRPMQAADIHECVEIVAAHPVVAPRYQDTIEDLHVAWHRLLDCDAKTQVVFEEVEEDRTRILGAGVSVFVTDDFVRWLKAPPFPWFGPELARRIARGQS